MHNGLFLSFFFFFFVPLLLLLLLFFFNMKHADQRMVRKAGFPSADHVVSTYLSAPIRSAEEARREETSRHSHLKQVEQLFHT